MFKHDAQEAASIVNVVLDALLEQTPTQGVPGAAMRVAIVTFRLNAEALLMADEAGAALQNIFQLSQANGISLPQMEIVRQVAVAEAAVSVGAILIRDSLVQYALATEGRILADITFTSRDDVEAVRAVINSAFGPSEDAAADAMDSTVYQQLVRLHAAISYFLTQTAQPLPRMLDFAFNAPMPTLVAAYRLYSDASRADELRSQNHVVHPAFMLPTGRALSN